MLKRSSFIPLFMVFIIILSLCFNSTVYAASPKLKISGKTIIKRNKIYSYSLKLYPNANKICAVKIYLKYSPKYLKYISLTPKTTHYAIEKSYTKSSGLIKFTVGLPNCVASTKTLFTIKFKTRKTGNTKISFYETQLANNLGNYTSVGKKNLSVRIK